MKKEQRDKRKNEKEDYRERNSMVAVNIQALVEFAPLAECYRLSSATPEEKEHKETVMEEKLLDASMVPVEIMEKALELLEILDVLADKGSRMAVSDVGVAVQFTRTALLGAVMNVYINTKSMKNREKAEEINQGAKRMIKIGTSQADEIYEKVLAQLV